MTTARGAEAMEEQDLLQAMVRDIVSAGQPRCVVLFGSRARGEAGRDSDYDFLVIEESDLGRPHRSRRYYQAVRDYLVPVDIIVYTPEEVEAYRGLDQSFIMTALREGQVVYASAG